MTYTIKLDVTREDYTAEEIKEALAERLKARRLALEEKEMLTAYTYQVQDEDEDEVVAVKNTLHDAIGLRDSAAAQAEAAEKRLREINAAAFEHLDGENGIDASLAEIDAEIKQFVLRQVFSERKGALDMKLGGFRVTRSRTNVVAVQYDDDEVLESVEEEYPDLLDLEVDGDPLFPRHVNVGLADRLLEDEDTPEELKEILRANRSETFKRTPTVKILPDTENSNG